MRHRYTTTFQTRGQYPCAQLALFMICTQYMHSTSTGCVYHEESQLSIRALPTSLKRPRGTGACLKRKSQSLWYSCGLWNIIAAHYIQRRTGDQRTTIHMSHTAVPLCGADLICTALATTMPHPLGKLPAGCTIKTCGLVRFHSWNNYAFCCLNQRTVLGSQAMHPLKTNH